MAGAGSAAGVCADSLLAVDSVGADGVLDGRRLDIVVLLRVKRSRQGGILRARGVNVPSASEHRGPIGCPWLPAGENSPHTCSCQV